MTSAGIRGRHRGVSLVEALVAMAVMAFGMLALVGVQATLRMNSDLAKQRSEATRIATEELENLRGFTAVGNERPTLSPVPSRPANFGDIQPRTVSTYPPDDLPELAEGVGNASYSLARSVTLVAGTRQKAVTVRVSWDDRTGVNQTVTMDTVISATDPRLSGLLALPTPPSATNQRAGRHPTIPPEAVALPNQRSGFKPFGTGTVYWVFNDLTGEIFSRCSNEADAPPNVEDTCDAVTALLLAGEVSFNFRLHTVSLSAEVAVLRPVAGSTAVLKIDANTQRIVNGSCTMPPASTNLAELSCAESDVDPGRLVTPYAPPSCASPPCTPDPATTLVAEDSESPQWPPLNLSLVRSSTGNTALDATQFNQSRAPECVTDAPTTLESSLSRARWTVRYFCFVYPNSGGWGGRFDLQPLAFPDTKDPDNNALAWSTNTGGLKVCRYTQAASEFTINRDHPATYCVERSGAALTSTAPCRGQRVTGNLINQNFLVIGGTQSCPTDVPIDLSTGNLINSKTLQHQP